MGANAPGAQTVEGLSTDTLCTDTLSGDAPCGGPRPHSEAAPQPRLAPYPGSWAVYVHFPFCLHRCNYCDFATVAHRDPPRERVLAACLAELALRCEGLEPAPIRSVFFGGGTPSLWGAPAISAILGWLDRWAGLAADCEITLEANPGAAEEGDLRGYVAAGVTRISLGVQALSDQRLRQLDRIHDAEAAWVALRTLGQLRREGGLRAASADLIYGLPGQTAAELRADVTALLDHGLTHLSAYTLTIESGTPLQRLVARGLAPATDDAHQAAMLEQMPALVASHGLQRYEVSNFAVPGSECRHNLAYWQGHHYLAVGVGAHGFLPCALPGAFGIRTANTRSVAAWFEALEAGRLAEAPPEVATAESHLDEWLLTGLRLRDGIDLAAVAARFGDTVASALAQAAAAVPGLQVVSAVITVEAAAIVRLDDVIASLAVSVSRRWQAARALQRRASGGIGLR